MRYKINKLVLIALLVILSTTGFRCTFQNKETQQALEPVTLNYWRVWDDRDDFTDIINSYSALHPNITINYRKLRYEEYEQKLLEAFAEDRGPDIFSLHSSWLRKYQSKLSPLPKETKMAYQYTKKSLGFKTETITEVRTNPSLTTKDITDKFVDIVSDEVIIDGKIYGLPLGMDTLVLFYNKDLLNNSGIPEPPTSWSELQEDVSKLTKQDKDGNIIQAGVALGTASNIERSFDILSLLMMQNGTQMASDSGQPTFHMRTGRGELSPAEDALRFYTDFSNPAKQVYSWNDKMENSLKAFINGKLAYFFGYSYHLQTVKSQAPKLNFGVTNMPQIQNNTPINYANYWVETVAKKSKHKNEAWDFLQFAASPEHVKSYLQKTHKATALRSLIEEQKKDPDVSVFASQVLTAKNWYRGKDANNAERFFKEMIDKVVTGKLSFKQAIQEAYQKVRQTY